MFSAQNLWAENIQSFSQSHQWLRLYQYKNNKIENNQSQVQSQIFFFSPDGMTSPLKELEASIAAYQDTKKLYGTLQLPAACAFPARKSIIEKNLNIQFPKVSCPDLDEWINRIDSDKLAIDFAGAYSGNPASILGHTFFRFYREGKTREGHDLLSHAVGFLAVSTPGDSRAVYMIKGLLGQYPGYYQIEPFYMKVGIYNNSESRDIWEQKLNLNPAEVKLALMLLWEYSFNSKIPYYFIDENCSYRLLSFLEIIRPEANLISELSTVVLPADTVRVLLENKLADPEPKFRSSILKRLNLKVDNLTPQEKSEFENSKKNFEALTQTQNSKVLDALIDYWTYTNYKALTNLSPEKSKLMEETFLKRSKLSDISPTIDDEAFKKDKKLIPPYQGHKTSWVALSGGSKETVGQSNFHGKFSYRMGAHALTDYQSGYEEIAAIEYLGFDIESRGEWKALLVDVKSLEPLNAAEKKWSWLANIALDNNKSFVDQEDTRVVLKGGGGGTYAISNFGKFYFIPELKSDIWINSEIAAVMGVGFEGGFIFNLRNISILLNNETLWNRYGNFASSKMSFNYHIKFDHTVFTDLILEDTNVKKMHGNIKTLTLGYKLHF